MKRQLILLLTILPILVFSIAGPAISRQAAQDRKKIPTASIGLGPGIVRHVSPEILGRISGGSDGNLLRGRKIRVLLKKGGHTVFSRVKTLDASGACSYRFLPMTVGRYTVRIEKVASGAGMTSRANVCFTGTRPATRTVTLSSSALRATGQNFIIRFNISWDRHGLCW